MINSRPLWKSLRRMIQFCIVIIVFLMTGKCSLFTQKGKINSNVTQDQNVLYLRKIGLIGLIFVFIENKKWNFVFPHTFAIIETFSVQSSGQKYQAIICSSIFRLCREVNWERTVNEDFSGIFDSFVNSQGTVTAPNKRNFSTFLLRQKIKIENFLLREEEQY